MKEELIGKTQKGFATLEILIAFAVVILSLSAVIMVNFSNQSLSVDLETNNEAIGKAQAMLEKERADSRFDFNLVNPYTTTETSGGLTYTKKIEVETPDLWTKRVISTVSWQDAGRLLFSRFITLVTNSNIDDTCSSVLENAEGWKNPIYYTFPSVNFGGPNANGVQMSDLDVFNKRMYITASDTPNPSPYSFFVLQLTDDPADNPTIIGQVDNNSNSLVGLNAVRVHDNYAYVANAYTGSDPACIVANNCAQLQIIDISNPVATGWSPTIKNLKIPAITTGNKLAAGKSIFYYKGYVYIGLTAANTSGNEFNIIDVGGGGLPASPTNPILKGGYDVGHDVNSIFVKDNFAYIASPNTENLLVLNIEDPTSPQKADGYTPVSGLNNGESVTVLGNTAYLGRAFGSDEFHVLSIDSDGNISFVAKKDIGTSNQTSIHGLLIRDYLAFMITLDQFQIWNISDLNNFQPWTSDGTMNTFFSMAALGGSGKATNCEGDRIYIAVTSSQGNNKDILALLMPGIAKLTPAITTEIHDSSHNAITTATTGAVIHDKAIVSGSGSTPTGTVDFTYYTDGACSVGSTSAGTVTLSSGVAHPSTSKTVTTAGSYSFKAHYNGDSNYNAGDGSCEPITVTPAFTYTLSNVASPLKVDRNLPPVPVIVTVTKAAGAIPQPVTVQAPHPDSNLSITPSDTLTCTPNVGDICQITFTYAYTGTTNGTYNGQIMTSMPNGTNSNTFQIKVIK